MSTVTLRGARTGLFTALAGAGLGLACALAGACSAGTSTDASGGSGGTASSGTLGTGSTGTGFMTSGTGTGGTDDCAASAKLIYLVSVDNNLYSFDPNIPGTGAYKPVGPLSCPATGNPQSMSVDRAGTAYVFYDSGQMFTVSTTTAACTATTYKHPVMNGFNQLGMGFTATTPNMKDETLFVISPDFGLATVGIPGYQVSQTGKLVTAAELTGGFDGKLFMFEASSATIAEIDRASFSKTNLHTFNGLQGTAAWAFSRYAGKFYMFTSPGVGIGTTTTQYDPVMKVETVRDGDIGFTVVGAGQSTCVPPPPPL
jgi:hypothetical protein